MKDRHSSRARDLRHSGRPFGLTDNDTALTTRTPRVGAATAEMEYPTKPTAHGRHGHGEGYVLCRFRLARLKRCPQSMRCRRDP